MIITPEQIRAARAILRMGEDDLAQRANVSVSTVQALEASVGQADESLPQVQQALEDRGIEFIERGVRYRLNSPEAAERYATMREISRRGGEYFRDKVILTDDDMYDENGVPH